MFLHTADDRSGALAIPQTSHAWMSWQLASHWGNRRFARPSPQADVLAAALLHDVGWTEFDSDPGVDSGGRPVTFDRMPVADHLAIWERCIERVALHSRYAAVLVASHVDRLAGRKERDVAAGEDRELLPAVQQWRARTAARLEGWTEELAADPRYSPVLAGPRREGNAAVVSACDAVSVYLCAGRREAFTLEAAGRSLEPMSIGFEAIGERVWKVRPWPLQGHRLDLHCEGRRLETTAFSSASELREALVRAPTERLLFTLVSPSRSATG